MRANINYKCSDELTVVNICICDDLAIGCKQIILHNPVIYGSLQLLSGIPEMLLRLQQFFILIRFSYSNIYLKQFVIPTLYSQLRTNKYSVQLRITISQISAAIESITSVVDINSQLNIILITQISQLYGWTLYLD